VSSSTRRIPPASAPTSDRSAADRKHPFAAALIAAWAVATLVVISILGLPHMAPAGLAAREQRTIEALLALRPSHDRPLAVHVIAAHCSCTERLFRHLVERPRFGGVDEVLLFVGDDARRQEDAQRAGLRYATVTDDELVRRFALEAAPALFLFDARGHLRYAGGYFDHPSAARALDVQLQARLARGEAPEPLPIYGCAVR